MRPPCYVLLLQGLFASARAMYLPPSTSHLRPRSPETTMFSAGCFMAIFFSSVFVALILWLQRRHIIAGWRRCAAAVQRLPGDPQRDTTAYQRVTDYRKSLPPIPSTPSPASTASSTPSTPSPWPRPLALLRPPNRESRRAWRTFHPPFYAPFHPSTHPPVHPAFRPPPPRPFGPLSAVELPAAPVPLRLLQVHGLRAHPTWTTSLYDPGSACDSPTSPQIQLAQLARLQRVQQRAVYV